MISPRPVIRVVPPYINRGLYMSPGDSATATDTA